MFYPRCATCRNCHILVQTRNHPQYVHVDTTGIGALSVDDYLVRDALILEGFEKLAFLEGCQQALLVSKLEKHVAPVADERGSAVVYLVIHQFKLRRLRPCHQFLQRLADGNLGIPGLDSARVSSGKEG